MPARTLAWYPGSPGPTGDWAEYADIAVLEHTVGPPHYEVHRNSPQAFNPGLFEARVWYGNRGQAVDRNPHAGGSVLHRTAEDAKAACQAHYDRLVDENSR